MFGILLAYTLNREDGIKGDSLMKVAIPVYGERVCPRFGYTRDFLIVDLEGGKEIDRKVLKMEIDQPARIADRLAKEGVSLILSGGMNPYFQEQFRMRNIGVIWGLIGDPNDVLATYLDGRVFSGMGPCPARGRRRRSRRRAILSEKRR
jgi:predicted Fe-Mo cluster-binding NifX family protein